MRAEFWNVNCTTQRLVQPSDLGVSLSPGLDTYCNERHLLHGHAEEARPCGRGRIEETHDDRVVAAIGRLLEAGTDGWLIN
jgi:hypothetical protein